MTARVSERVARWRDAWQGRSPEAVAALYRVDAIHESAKVGRAMPELGRTHLEGSAELGALKRRALDRVGNLHFEIVKTVEDARASVVEYLAHSDRRPARDRVVECIEWGPDGLIAASRVYHF